MKKFVKKSDAHYVLNNDLSEGKEINIFANENILESISDTTIKQSVNTAKTYGVEAINLNADAHEGYGCPIGSVVATEKTIMLGPIGFDISCSMSYLQTNIPYEEVISKEIRRKIIDSINEYVPHGAGKKRAKKQAKINNDLYHRILNFGVAESSVVEELEINPEWLHNLERTALEADSSVLSPKSISRGEGELGSLGSGNHFLEGQKVEIIDSDVANKWGVSNSLGIMTHCGSRGIGHQVATEYFEKLWKYFSEKNITLRDRDLVYAISDESIGKKYLLSMGCAANFAIVNHLIINTAVCNAIKRVFPEAEFNFVYHISHNLAQKEKIGQKEYYIHRKGATRAFPAGHEMLKDTQFYDTGHPVIIPGSSITGSSLMVGVEGNEKNFCSTPHGSGRALGRREARRKLTQEYVNQQMLEADVITNRRNYPVDEFGEAYKDYNEVISSIESAGLAREIAKLKPIFVIKGD